MSWIGAVFSAVGQGASGYGNFKANEAQSQIQLENARTERQLSLDEAAQADREAFQRMGEMRAAAGGSGSTSGSYSDVFADSAAQLTLRKQSIVYAGSVNAQRLFTGAQVTMAKGLNARTAGVGAAAGEFAKYYAGRSSNGGAGTTLVNSGGGADGSGTRGGSDYPG